MTAAFIGLALCPLLVLGAVISWQIYSDQKQQALQYQYERARHVSTQVESFIRGLERDLLLTNGLQSILERDTKEQNAILGGLLSFEKFFEELTLVNKYGQEIASVHYAQIITPAMLGSRARADEFLVPKDTGKTYFGPVRFHEQYSEPFMVISIPLVDLIDGQVQGVFIAAVRLKKIWDLLAGMRIGAGESVYLLDAEKRVVAHQDPSVVLRKTFFKLPTERVAITNGLQGQQVVMAIAEQSYGEQTLYVVAEKTTAEAFGLAHQTLRITTLVAVISLVAAVSIIIFTVGNIVQPIQELASVAREIMGGNLNRQAKISSKDEVGALAEAFNSMTRQLRHTLEGLEKEISDRKITQKKLVHAHALLKNLIDSIPDLIFYKNKENVYLGCNRAFAQFSGRTEQEIIGRTDSEFFARDVAKIFHAYEHHLRDVAEPDHMEDWLAYPDGRRVLFDTLKTPYYNPDGTVLGIIGVSRDITELKKAHEELEQRVFERTAELVSANERLKQEIDERMRTEQALKKEKEKAQQYLDVAGVMMVALNAAGEIILINQEGCDILQVKEEEVLGKNWFDTFLPPENAEEVKSVFTKLMAGKTELVEFHENPVLTATGAERLIAFHNSMLIDEHNNIVGVLSSGEDITERKKAEQDLRKYAQTQEVLLREVNHRVKNNLSAVIGMLYKELDCAEEKGMTGYLNVLNDLVGRIAGLSTVHSMLSASGWGGPCLSANSAVR